MAYSAGDLNAEMDYHPATNTIAGDSSPSPVKKTLLTLLKVSGQLFIDLLRILIVPHLVAQLALTHGAKPLIHSKIDEYEGDLISELKKDVDSIISVATAGMVPENIINTITEVTLSSQTIWQRLTDILDQKKIKIEGEVYLFLVIYTHVVIFTAITLGLSMYKMTNCCARYFKRRLNDNPPNEPPVQEENIGQAHRIRVSEDPPSDPVQATPELRHR